MSNEEVRADAVNICKILYGEKIQSLQLKIEIYEEALSEIANGKIEVNPWTVVCSHGAILAKKALKEAKEKWVSEISITKIQLRTKLGFLDAKNVKEFIDSEIISPTDREVKLQRKVEIYEEALESAREVLHNYEVCSQNPHNEPTVSWGHINKLRENIILCDQLKEAKEKVWKN